MPTRRWTSAGRTSLFECCHQGCSPSSWLLNRHDVSLSLISQWGHATCGCSNLFESSGCMSFLARLRISGLAPFDDLRVGLDMCIQWMVEFILQVIRDDHEEIGTELFRYKLDELLTVLTNKLCPLVQVG